MGLLDLYINSNLIKIKLLEMKTCFHEINQPFNSQFTALICPLVERGATARTTEEDKQVNFYAGKHAAEC